MDIEYQRNFKLLDMFIKEGAIFLMHPAVIDFGEEDKKHYSISKNNLKFGFTFAKFNPCTSQEKDIKRKDIFILNFDTETTFKKNDKRITYVLLGLSKTVQLTDIMKPILCEYKGTLLEKALAGYRQAKREFVLWNHNRKITA